MKIRSVGKMQDRKRELPEKGRTVGVNLPNDLVERLHLEAVRSGVTLREVVCSALNAYIPRSLKCITTQTEKIVKDARDDPD